MSEPERCSYILPKKRRTCKMLVKSGKQFCGEHAVFDPENTERIPCPNDPKHTVKKSELEDHLRNRCNARIAAVPWLVENLNVTDDKDQGTSRCGSERRPDEKRLTHICKLIRKAFISQFKRIQDLRLEVDIIEEQLKRTDMNATHRKHLTQHSSIIGHLLEAGLLKDNEDCCVVDFGSGKAQLSYWMAKIAPKCHFLLIDRMGCRNKHDNKALQENTSLRIVRLRCSIEHLDLSKVDAAKDAKNLVAVCKHFCGSATDCGIRCLHNAVKGGLHLSGFAMAPCCHHKSAFNDYVGRSFLEKCGFEGTADFDCLRYVATWAVCGMLREEQQIKEKTTEDTVDPPAALIAAKDAGDPDEIDCDNPLIWTRCQKEFLGRQAKALLELGRADYLEELGYDVSVYRYVPFSISPENLLIVGVQK